MSDGKSNNSYQKERKKKTLTFENYIQIQQKCEKEHFSRWYTTLRCGFLSVCILLYYVDVVVKSNFFYSRTISHLSGFVSSKFICIKAAGTGAASSPSYFVPKASL